MSETAASLAPPASNAPELSVTELSGAIRQTLELAFARVRVRGEVTEAKTYASGHTYFCLKDERAKIRAVLWKSQVPKAGLLPENGAEVIATGRVSAYGDRSEYQLVVERLEYAGAGALLARIEAVRLKLAAEGLFDPARKQKIPMLPAIIGVITSAQGAVLHDIRTTVARRFPRPILLWPVPVQGQGAAERIAAAIAGMDRLPQGGLKRPDVLIVARGGGSLEDLLAFNEEIVVRAAAACGIPLISAVGHETDTTLIDHVADRRAPTPTAAAEMAVPARAELAAALAQSGARLIGGIARTTRERRHALAASSGRLPDLPALLAASRQRLDDRARRLGLALPGLVAGRGAALHVLSVRHLGGLRHAVQAARAQAAAVRLSPAPISALLRERRARLEGFAARLEGASYERVLASGFALVRDGAGHAVVSAEAVRPGARLRLRFADGETRVTADRAQGKLLL